MRRATASFVLTFAALAASCGTTTEPSAEVSTTSSTTDPTPTSTTEAPRPEWSGPRTLIAKHLDDLYAIDLVDGSRRKLADRGELAAAHGVIEAYIGAVELSPDGKTVVFGFEGHLGDDDVHGLYEVPADGTAAPRPREIPGTSGEVFHLEYSPDGRFLLAMVGRLMVVTPAEGGAPVSPGLDFPYPPRSVIWSPAGDQLIWVTHTERTPCCHQASVQVDPETGAYASEVSGTAVEGPPYFDVAGELQVYPHWNHRSLDFDASRRWAVAIDIDDPEGPVVWWDTTDPSSEPQPLDVELIPSDEEGVSPTW